MQLLRLNLETDINLHPSRECLPLGMVSFLGKDRSCSESDPLPSGVLDPDRRRVHRLSDLQPANGECRRGGGAPHGDASAPTHLAIGVGYCFRHRRIAAVRRARASDSYDESSARFDAPATDARAIGATARLRCEPRPVARGCGGHTIFHRVYGHTGGNAKSSVREGVASPGGEHRGRRRLPAPYPQDGRQASAVARELADGRDRPARDWRRARVGEGPGARRD